MASDLYQHLEEEMKSAMKSGDSTKLSVLRMAISAIKTTEINKKAKRLAEQDVIQILQTQAKQHRESIEQFNKGLRPDLAKKESEELKILESYMPKQMDESEIESMVKSSISETLATSKSDIGKVMKSVMEKAKGRCDGKTVNHIAMKYLK